MSRCFLPNLMFARISSQLPLGYSCSRSCGASVCVHIPTFPHFPHLVTNKSKCSVTQEYLTAFYNTTFNNLTNYSRCRISPRVGTMLLLSVCLSVLIESTVLIINSKSFSSGFFHTSPQTICTIGLSYADTLK